MQRINFTAVFVTALIPMFVGFVYYSKFMAGNAWMKVTGITEEKAKEANMVMILIISYVLSVILATTLNAMVIHQFGLQSLFVGDLDNPLFAQVMEAKGDAYRTFKHGAFHGLLGSITFALPILGINALFEQRGWKYIFIHLGYWAITLTLMGGVVAAWQ